MDGSPTAHRQVTRWPTQSWRRRTEDPFRATRSRWPRRLRAHSNRATPHAATPSHHYLYGRYSQSPSPHYFHTLRFHTPRCAPQPHRIYMVAALPNRPTTPPDLYVRCAHKARQKYVRSASCRIIRKAHVPVRPTQSIAHWNDPVPHPLLRSHRRLLYMRFASRSGQPRRMSHAQGAGVSLRPGGEHHPTALSCIKRNSDE